MAIKKVINGAEVCLVLGVSVSFAVSVTKFEILPIICDTHQVCTAKLANREIHTDKSMKD